MQQWIATGTSLMALEREACIQNGQDRLKKRTYMAARPTSCFESHLETRVVAKIMVFCRRTCCVQEEFLILTSVSRGPFARKERGHADDGIVKIPRGLPRYSLSFAIKFTNSVMVFLKDYRRLDYLNCLVGCNILDFNESTYRSVYLLKNENLYL